METRANGSHRSRRAAVLAVHKVQTTDRVARERRVGRAAHLARDVLRNVLTQQRFDVLGHVATANDETLVAVDRSLRTQLSQSELQHVLGRTVHHLADLLEVHPQCLLGTHTHELRRLHRVSLAVRQFRVVLVQFGHDTRQKLVLVRVRRGVLNQHRAGVGCGICGGIGVFSLFLLLLLDLL